MSRTGKSPFLGVGVGGRAGVARSIGRQGSCGRVWVADGLDWIAFMGITSLVTVAWFCRHEDRQSSGRRPPLCTCGGNKLGTLVIAARPVRTCSEDSWDERCLAALSAGPTVMRLASFHNAVIVVVSVGAPRRPIVVAVSSVLVSVSRPPPLASGGFAAWHIRQSTRLRRAMARSAAAFVSDGLAAALISTGPSPKRVGAVGDCGQ